MPTPLDRLQYGFDRDSRRSWRRRALTTGEDNFYGYDRLSQVVQGARGNLNLNQSAVAGVPASEEAWDYDPTGNWKGYTVEAAGAVTLDQARVHDKGNRMTQVAADPNPVLLDRVGRMVEMPPGATGDWNESLKLKWDAWSRITEVRSAGDDTVLGSYGYDGLTRRTTRTVGGSTQHSYYSDAWRPLEERKDSETTARAQYLWGARHRDDLVRRDRDSTGGGTLDETRYVLMDYFSPASITDESGTVTERYAFSAFGIRRILAPDFTPRSTSECAFEFAFQGQFLDTESGLYDYGYRYYSPFLGRWTAKDPIGEAGGLNLYGMVGNGAVNSVDHLGLAAPFPIIIKPPRLTAPFPITIKPPPPSRWPAIIKPPHKDPAPHVPPTSRPDPDFNWPEDRTPPSTPGYPSVPVHKDPPTLFFKYFKCTVYYEVNKKKETAVCPIVDSFTGKGSTPDEACENAAQSAEKSFENDDCCSLGALSGRPIIVKVSVPVVLPPGVIPA